jgi:hypothetical protein
MNAKTFSILAVITLIVIIAAVVLTQQERTTTSEKPTFFPDLDTVLNDVTEINISTQGETVTLIRDENGQQWRLKEKHNYPVAVEKVHNLLLGAADLTVLEAKTSKPASYSKIGVEDVTEENAQSTLITFEKAAGETLASLIVGNDRVAKTDSTRREIYVRKPDEKQAWLTLGQLPREKEATDWLVQEIVNLDSDNIRQVSITHPDGENFLVFKETPKEEEFQLADLPENAKVKFPYMLRNIATTLTRLDLDDVMVATEMAFDEKATTRAVFTTFDGLEVTIRTMEKDGKHYATFAAAFNPDAVYVAPPKTDDKAASSEGEDAQSEKADEKADEKAEQAEEKPKVDAKAEELNAKFQGWVYTLSQYKVDDLEKKREELISVEEASADKAEETEQLPAINLDGLDLPAAFGTPTTTTPMLPLTAP